MSVLPKYSSLFSTLYDEQHPVGYIGRGTHYSVLRSVEWHDVLRAPLPSAQIHDFSIIWDEDHDTRVLEAVEIIYMAGLLSPIQFIGERKGMLTVLLASKFLNDAEGSELDDYTSALHTLTQSLPDPWTCQLGSFDRSTLSNHQCDSRGIIQADEGRALTYLKHIDSLWRLGTHNYVHGQ